MSDDQIPRAWCAENGVTLDAVLVSDGGLKDPSKWKCTIKRGRASYTFDYSAGSAHRRIKMRNMDARAAELGIDPKDYAAEKYPKLQTLLDKARYGGARLTDYERAQWARFTEPDPPSVDGALWCLVCDASCVRHGQTFEEFCSELGYDSDSRTAERVFNACRDTWSALVRLGFDLDELDRVFQDY